MKQGNLKLIIQEIGGNLCRYVNNNVQQSEVKYLYESKSGTGAIFYNSMNSNANAKLFCVRNRNVKQCYNSFEI